MSVETEPATRAMKRSPIDRSSPVPRKRVKKESKPVAVKKEPASSPKKSGSAPASKKVKAEPNEIKSEENDEDEQLFKWWEDQQEDDSIKWTTLEHNGVLFPPEYEPLPKNVRLIYDGKPVVLPPAAEEVAGFFGAMLNSGDHAKNPTFQKNFFADFKDVLKKSGGAKDVNGNKVNITAFSKMNFSKIFDHYEAQRQIKKSLPASEKKKLKEEKDKSEEKYKFCMLDGRKQPVGNFRIEPPGLFRGRGAHPKTGKLKARVQPEQVTINIGESAHVPEPPKGHKWAEVRNDNTVSWLAMWKENINGAIKYVFLAQNSSLKGMSDFKKFEKARELKNHVERIRKDYTKELKDELMEKRQRATAMYLIDKLALRAGGEKGEDEADTVGCCSLRFEHVTLKPPRTVVFDFLGKDSIRYHQEVEVDPQVFKNLKIFKKAPKKSGDDIFDRLDPPTLNKHLQNYMPGLTAKVFRTYNASHTMQQQLDLIPNKGTVNEKVVMFNAANREVAILCNHQRTVAKTHEASVGKIEDTILELQWSKIQTLKALLKVDPKAKERTPKLFKDMNILTKEKVKKIHSKILAREKERIEKKFARENDKLVAEKEKPMGQDELKKRLQAIDDMKQDFRRELEDDVPNVKGPQTAEKLLAKAEQFDQRIHNKRLALKDKEDNSTVALGTSKTNYIDPRLAVMFSKKYEVPIEKLFTKTLREKFAWAVHSADADWKF